MNRDTKCFRRIFGEKFPVLNHQSPAGNPFLQSTFGEGLVPKVTYMQTFCEEGKMHYCPPYVLTRYLSALS